MNCILASTSTLYKGKYLEYLKENIQELYTDCTEILFIPFAQPGGISYEDYTQKVAAFFSEIGIKTVGLHTFADAKKAIEEAKAYFVGGGNTFLLVKTLYDLDIMETLAENIKKGKPYLGTSAGSNIAGQTMQTTNDMPIVQPKKYDCLKLMPFNLNPHYLDPIPNFPHNGETRETRIMEYLSINEIPVIGLREGNWIRILQNKIWIEGENSTRIFEKNKLPYEVETATILCQ